VLALATTGPEGLWSAAVFYANDDFRLIFLSALTTRHALNIAAHPEVAGTVQEDYPDWPEIQGIQFEGVARQLHGDDQARAVDRYLSKFPLIETEGAPEEIGRALTSVAWFEMEPHRLFFVDNTRGFGHRDEIDLP